MSRKSLLLQPTVNLIAIDFCYDADFDILKRICSRILHLDKNLPVFKKWFRSNVPPRSIDDIEHNEILMSSLAEFAVGFNDRPKEAFGIFAIAVLQNDFTQSIGS